MKFSTVLILALLGAVAFVLFHSSQKKGREQAAMTLVPNSSAPPQPLPSVHVANLAVVHGQVTDLVGDRAVINCEYVAKLSPSAQARWRQIAVSAGEAAPPGLSKMAQAEAELETFGKLQSMSEDGQMRIANWIPRNQARGRVMLTGLNVRKGGFVNVVAAPLRTEPGGVPVYTTRYMLMGGAWMWNDRKDNLGPR